MNAFCRIRLAVVTVSLVGVAAACEKYDATRDEIIATVGNVAITRGMFEEALAKELANEDAREHDHRLKNRVLKRMVETERLRQLATALTVEVTDAEVEERVRAAAKRMGGDDKLMDYLHSRGSDMERFRQTEREFLMRTRVANPHQAPSEQDLREYFERHKHKYPAPRIARFERIRIQETHAALQDEPWKAQLLSPNAWRKFPVEDLGWISEGGRQASRDLFRALQDGSTPAERDLEDAYHPEFQRVAFSLKPGETSEVFHTPAGYQVVRMRELAPVSGIKFEDVEARVREDWKLSHGHKGTREEPPALQTGVDAKIFIVFTAEGEQQRADP